MLHGAYLIIGTHIKAVLLLRLRLSPFALNEAPGKLDAGGMDSHVERSARTVTGRRYVWSDMERLDSLSRLEDLEAVTIVALGVEF